MDNNQSDSGQDDNLITGENFDALQREEMLHIFGRNDPPESKKLRGLAFSGGGIRSAVFSLGVMQGLHHNGMLDKFHYLSTVSGGGYIGACLTWLLHWTGQGGQPRFDTAKQFPLSKQAEADNDPVARPLLRHLRQSSKYLTPGGGITMASLLAVILRGSLLSLLVYLVPLIGLMALLVLAHAFGNPDELAGHPRLCGNIVLYAAALAGSVFALLAVYYGLATSKRSRPADEAYRERRLYEKCAGRLLVAGVALAAIGLLPLVAAMFGDLRQAMAASLTGGGLATSVLAIFKAQGGKEGRLPLGLVAPLAFVLLVYGVLLCGFETGLSISTSGSWLAWGLLLAGLLLAWLLGTRVNINYISIHRYYRDRLMELFMPDLDDILGCNCAATADAANSSTLHTMCRPGSAPYHLINANMVTEGSTIKRLKERGGENFVLSPLYCGSQATGWVKTASYMGQKMNLATAMAISGAAADPHGAPGGSGLTRNRSLSFLMALFNVRLGYWAPNPARHQARVKNSPDWFRYGLRELLGNRMDETSEFVHLADGGHFENLALYELIRRQVHTIVVCDGAADKGFSFNDFANLVEKVRVDFGVQIEVQGNPVFKVNNTQAKSLLAMCPKPNVVHPHGVPLADAGFVTATIKYGKGVADGTLIYVKTTLISRLPDDIYSYKRAHDDFPDESTADQFFDEKQFEAYRELGYRIGLTLAENEEVAKALGLKPAKPARRAAAH